MTGALTLADYPDAMVRVACRKSDSLDALRPVVLHTVDGGADPVGAHLLERVGPEQLGHVARRVLAQPRREIVGRQDHRHAVVEWAQELVGARRDDGAALDGHAPSGALSHRSHRPAKAKGSPSLSVMRHGTLRPGVACHS